jgi:hypothetical protein
MLPVELKILDATLLIPAEADQESLGAGGCKGGCVSVSPKNELRADELSLELLALGALEASGESAERAAGVGRSGRAASMA